MNTYYEEAAGTTSILIAGLGGQGILHLSKVLTYAGQRRFRYACRSEFRGLSQRGGSVHSIVRFSPAPLAPVLAAHGANLVLSMDALEAVRAEEFLADDGHLFTDSETVPPLHVARAWEAQGKAIRLGQAFREGLQGHLDALPQCLRLDLAEFASQAGDARAANVVLLGAASWLLPIPAEELREAVRACVKPTLQAVNLVAFQLGRDAARHQVASFTLEEAGNSVTATQFAARAE